MHAEQQLWRTEKYRVMYYSQAHYNQIRLMMREDCTLEDLQRTINEALALTPTDGSRCNALQHMWGYFKKYATIEQKEYYRALLDEKDWQELRHYLAALAKQYDVVYLQESTILQQD